MSRAVAVAAVVLVVASFGAGPTLAQSQQNGLQTPDGFDTTTFRLMKWLKKKVHLNLIE